MADRIEHIPWTPLYPLGRSVEHDPRSVQYGYEPVKKVALKSITWPRQGGIFTQAIGSCTGEAITGACNTKPVWATGVSIKTQDDAMRCYEKATVLDGFPGTYPPDDTGSSGLAACKAARSFGWITSYRWAFSVETALQALMAGAICCGVNWYEGFDRPAANGLVKIAGSIRGGHEIMARQFDASQTRPSNRLVWFDNSWGTGYGVKGRFCMTVGTLDTLLHEQGDVAIPVR